MRLTISQSLIVFFSLTLGLQAYAQPSSLEISEKEALVQLLYGFNLGNDAFYNKALSPAKSLNMDLSDASRTQEVNDKITNEMDAVISAFNNSGDDKKLDAVKAQVNLIYPEINKNNGAYIQFVKGTPSAAYSRVILMIEKKAGNTTATGEQFLKSFSSYKRSAIPSTTIYEYSDAKNLSQSQIKTTEGSDTSWKLPQAAPQVALRQDLVLKKCRQILGWKCVTSLYHTGELLQNANNVKYLFAAIYDLKNNPDHPEFAKDKRGINQITGSTALYAIKESAKWIMIYGVDAQWNEDKISFAGLIQDEFQKDFSRIKERLMLDLKITAQDIK
ncbi:MAG: hypothetical protein ABL930_01365 [Pseudobdellovibrio sp.]